MFNSKKMLLPFLLMSGIVVAADLKDWKYIGGVGGIDRISQIHVHNLLLSHDIESMMEGSVVYEISVPTAKAEQASQLLRADARSLGYWLVLERNGSNEVVFAAERKKRVSRCAVSFVLKQPEYASETALGQFLRSKDISDLTAKFPYVVSLFVCERQYLSAPKTYSTGYDIEIELQKSLKERDDGYRGFYQIYDNGNHVSSLGSSEWTFGNNPTRSSAQIIRGTSSNAVSSISREQAAGLVSAIHEGMTFEQIAEIIPLSNDWLVVSEHGGLWYNAWVGEFHIQLRFEHPSATNVIEKCKLNYPPRLVLTE